MMYPISWSQNIKEKTNIMVSWLCLTTTVAVLAFISPKGLDKVKGQTSCTHGFPNLSTPTGSPRSFGTTRIIPGMMISCNGTITSWTLAGMPGTSNSGAFPLLKVFRQESSGGTGVYSFINQVELGKCGSDIALRNEDNFFICNLPEKNRLSVQQNDVIGIYSPLENQTAFEIYYTITSLTNYIYIMDVTSVVSISERDHIAHNTPQINLEITTSGTIITTSYSTKSTTNNVMPQTTTVNLTTAVTSNTTTSSVTIPPQTPTDHITITIITALAAMVVLLLVITTFYLLAHKYKKKQESLVREESFDQSEIIYVNARTNVFGIQEGCNQFDSDGYMSIADQYTHHDIEKADHNCDMAMTASKQQREPTRYGTIATYEQAAAYKKKTSTSVPMMTLIVNDYVTPVAEYNK